MLYKKNPVNRTSIDKNTSYEGERIEDKIDRIVNNNEPISDGAPLIYTERKDGVQPEYNVRTDRFEVAIDAIDKVSKAETAKREERAKAREEAKVVKLKGKEGGETGGSVNTSDEKK